MNNYKIDEKSIRENIVFSWKEQYKIYDYTPEEKVALIFSNLYRVLEQQTQFIELTYDTLLELVPSDNTNLISRLQAKKQEHLSGAVYS